MHNNQVLIGKGIPKNIYINNEILSGCINEEIDIAKDSPYVILTNNNINNMIDLIAMEYLVILV